MRKESINEKGRELFDEMRDSICEHNLGSAQTLCAVCELFLWVLLVIHEGDEKQITKQFDAMVPDIRTAIILNAPSFAENGPNSTGVLQ